eukprot:CAMPEP_0119371990 /NCGR_PEP_ID=MMETSP1334-20130426/18051_1 /TAXON_ID=127549 /ORGANISM="Calcidiscus leptoporus, Strain RCC1130" /LENGTH=134 /DNA_ID=CAMNT_0007389373 /DNA_START=462 /DNA_END=867 /DNA_ORIENTATION=-
MQSTDFLPMAALKDAVVGRLGAAADRDVATVTRLVAQQLLGRVARLLGQVVAGAAGARLLALWQRGGSGRGSERGSVGESSGVGGGASWLISEHRGVPLTPRHTPVAEPVCLLAHITAVAFPARHHHEVVPAST